MVHLVMLMIGVDLGCSGIISTEGVLRGPMTYDDHPNPIPSTYSIEDDLSGTKMN